MNVDETGGDQLAGGIDAAVGIGHFRADPDNTAVFHQQVQLAVDPIGRIDHMTAINQSFHVFPPSSVEIKASSRSRPR